MSRKRLTQIFPFLTPIRRLQKNCFFYVGMHFDSNIYAKEKSNKLLPFEIFHTKITLINENTGYDIKYQENKVFNVKLASNTINGVLIKPRETFSFWQLVRSAEKTAKYKEGLCLTNGKIKPKRGGGLCLISDLLFLLFLHSPLTITERHNHPVKEFPSPPDTNLEGIDATITEGWLDLKVTNNTENTFQIVLYFDDIYEYAYLLVNNKPDYKYEIVNRDLHYYRKDENIYESVKVIQQKIDKQTNKLVGEKKLYTNTLKILYELPDTITVEEE